jgi:hypothetical protein
LTDDAGSSGETEPRESILELISRKTGEAPSVSLSDRDSGVGSSPIALDPSMKVRFAERSRGNYQVLGEVARGGMGAILRGHDRDLRRDVAIKVLDEALAQRPEVVQRFVEEAQIGAQLQHPGVVPVYELGLMADERPFFTMKLVKGRTLASLLAARKSPETELRRFLAIFEQICQTLAYAHSKGVLHRDLKPANVMVGAFGEVQVVDWGLAKVLHRGGVADEKRALREQRTLIETVRSGPGSSGSDSVVGSVMGTPAYMPPEQARGEIDGLDERADVFALGAILCEILSGAPPYLETEDESVVVQAARAHLAPARARLAACRADEELVRHCLDCLAPAPQARPASADEVARAIHAYLSGTEERARAAQLAAAEARIHAVEESKRRRLTVALAGALVALLVAVGGGYLWIERQKEARRAEVRREVDGMQAAVLDLQGAGRHDEALATARAALARASEGVGDELAARLADFATKAEILAGEARVRRELEARNHALFQRLDEIELRRSLLGVSVTAADLDREYAAAFRDYGLEVESEDLVDTLAVLRARGMGAELALALDQWARVERVLSGWDSAAAEALTALAADLDPDPVRTEVRAALLLQDRDALFRMQDELDVARVPPATVWVLASAVDDLQGDPIALLERAVQRYPGDHRFRVLLGDEHAARDLLPLALRHLEAAHALQPENASVLQKLAAVQGDFGDFAAQVATDRELLERVPQFTSAHASLGFGLLMLGDGAGAVAAYAQAPEDLLEGTERAEIEVARYLSGALDAAGLAEAMRAIPLTSAYKQQIEAWALCIHGGRQRADEERALALVQEILPFTRSSWLTWYVLALANLRLGRPADVLAALASDNPAIRRVDIAIGRAGMRASAHHHLGDVAEARASLEEARYLFQSLVGTRPEAWERSSFLDHLREAEALIE